MSAKAGTKGTLCLTLEFDRAYFKDGFGWWPRNNLLYTLYRGEFKGTVAVSDGKELKTIATFTTKYESTTFNRRDTENPPRLCPEDHR